MAIHAGGRGPGHTARTARGVFSPGGTPLGPMLHAAAKFAMNVTDWAYYVPQLYYTNLARYGYWRRSSAGLVEEHTPTYVNASGDLIAMRTSENYTKFMVRSGSDATQRFKATWTGAALCTAVNGTGGTVTVISNVANQVIFTVTYTDASTVQSASLTFGYTASANPVVGLNVQEVDASNVPLYSGAYHPTAYNRNTQYNGIRFLTTNGMVNSANELRTINWADRTPASNLYPQNVNTQATLTLGSGNSALTFTAVSGYNNIGTGAMADSINAYGHTVGANGNNISITINAASGAGSVSVSKTGASIDIVVVPATTGTTATAVAAQITNHINGGCLVSVTAGGTGAGTVATATKTYLAGGIDALNPAGMPVEDMVAIANAAQCDLWLPLGANVSSDFVTNALTYVRDNLNSNLRLFLGLSNEVWNTSSPYFHGQIAFAAIARQQGLITTIGLGSAIDATRRGYAWKFNQIMTIAESVFSAARSRLVRCGEYIQHANAAAALDYLLKPSGTGSEAASYIGSHVDMLCSAPYFAVKSGSTMTYILSRKNAWATATAYVVGDYFYSLTTNKVYVVVQDHTSSGANPSTDETAGKTVEMTAAKLDPYVQASVLHTAGLMTSIASSAAAYTNDLGATIKYGCYEAGQQFYIGSDAPGQTLLDTYTAALYKDPLWKVWDGILYDQFRAIPTAGSMWETNNINGPFKANGLGFGVEEFPWSADVDSPRRLAFANADAGIYPPYFTTATRPAITGTRESGQTLTVSQPSANGTRSWQWLRDGSPISGATSATYVQVVGDEGHTIEVTSTLTTSFGSITHTTTGSAATTAPILWATITSTTGSPTITDYTDGSGTWRAYEWTANGGFTFTGTSRLEYELVAGGAGGGYMQYTSEGGGGAGGVLQGTTTMAGGTYPVVIGAGGTGGNDPTLPTNGGDSTAIGLTAIGGGRGGQGNYSPGCYAQAGGSGGGGTGAAIAGGAGTAGQGYAGAVGKANAGGGGGGAGGVGSAGDEVAKSGGNGGPGITSSITGTAVGIAGGGAGSGDTTSGTATHGGGNGNSGTAANSNGGDATTAGAGGGGGSPGSWPARGGDGFRGRFVLRVKTA